jgi:hypothetical protein
MNLHKNRTFILYVNNMTFNVYYIYNYSVPQCVLKGEDVVALVNRYQIMKIPKKNQIKKSMTEKSDY